MNDVPQPLATDRQRGAGGRLGLFLLFVVSLVVVSAIVVASPLLIRTFAFQPYTIPSAAMEPTLQHGDYVIVSKQAYGYSHHSILFSPPIFKGRIFSRPPTRGDIIVFKLPTDGHTDYIKRLIGLPGDHVQMKGGWLYLNGRRVVEKPLGTIGSADLGPVTEVRETNPEGRSYLTQIHGRDGPADNTGIYVVPAHCYFMMGDNRDNSADSRFDSGLAPDDPKLGGCGWDGRLDAAVSFGTGVGFVPEENLIGKAALVIRRSCAGELQSFTPR